MSEALVNPTEEQVVAREAFEAGLSLVMEAGAGTGKTSTLLLLAEATKQQGRYLAFNKSIVTEAMAKFPENVACSTAHSLAFRAVGRRFAHRLNGARMRSSEIAGLLGLDPFAVSGKTLTPEFLAGQVGRALTIFCASADEEPGVQHFAYIDGIDEPDPKGRRTWRNNETVRAHLLPALEAAWTDMQSEQGRLPFKHDVYLKLWQLDHPKLDAEFIFFDECQDANPVMDSIVAEQDAQLVYVGDSNQSIYAWRGAINSIARVRERLPVLFLSRSFRFGQAIANVANILLARLGAELRLEGSPEIQSRLERLDQPSVVLARTNAMAVSVLMRHQALGHSVHLVGGSGELSSLVKAAQRLQLGQRAGHPDLACFSGWAEVREYVKNDPQGSELKMFVDLVDEYGASLILRALDQTLPEEYAQVVVSTAHKAKGREWPTVQLAGDFDIGPAAGEAELRLVYVAVTRARDVLDDGGLLLSASGEARRAV